MAQEIAVIESISEGLTHLSSTSSVESNSHISSHSIDNWLFTQSDIPPNFGDLKRKRSLSGNSSKQLDHDLRPPLNQLRASPHSPREASLPTESNTPDRRSRHLHIEIIYWSTISPPLNASPTVCANANDIALLLALTRLTHDNLSSLNSAQSDMPATPAKSETTSSIILNSRNPTKIKELRKALSYNNLLIHDSRADLKEHPTVNQAIDEILKGERGSVAKGELWSNLEAVRSRYEWANELTFLVHFILAVLGDARAIKERPNDEMLRPDEIAYVMRSWDESGLFKGFSVTMKTGIVPKVNTKNKVLAALLAKFPRVKKPVPDVLFGLDETPFNDEQTIINDLFPEYSEVASGYRHAFGVLEAKDMSGDLEEAIVQACRGGAALVISRMQFNYQAIPGKKMNRVKNPKAKKDKTAKGEAVTEKAPSNSLSNSLSNSPQLKPGPDLQSFAFSITLAPKRAEVWVNWAEHRTGQATLFHMNFVDEYRLNDEDGMKGFRVTLFQIMDWGLATRKIQIQEVISQIDSKLNAGTPIESIEGEVDWDSDEDGVINVESEDDEAEPARKRRHGKK